MLILCLKNSYFFFNGQVYKQNDGLAKGNPMAPTIANIFLCQLESKFLEKCPSDFKPLFYRRYLDDTFVVFNSRSQCENFFKYLSSWHKNLKFTMEEEENGELSFLDVLVTKKDANFDYKVYRKLNFSGLATSFFSNTSEKFRKRAMYSLIHRAFGLSRSYESFHNEIQFLTKYFEQNGHPKFIFEKIVSKFLNSKFEPKPIQITVPKEVVHIKLPFLTTIHLKVS